MRHASSSNNNRRNGKRRNGGRQNVRDRGRERKPTFESLESRQLMSAGMSYADGILQLRGVEDAANVLTARTVNGGSHVALNFNGVTTYHKAYQVEGLKIVGGSKADTIYVADEVRARLDLSGGDGADSIYATGGNDVVADAEAADTIAGPAEATGIRALEQQQTGATPASAPAITRLALYDADADRAIPGYENLTDGVVIDLATLPTRNLSIRAYASDTQSIRLSLTGAMTRTQVENISPYVLFGDRADGSDVNGGTFQAGQYTLTANPFSKNRAMGLRGVGKTIRFTIVDGPAVGENPTEGKDNPTPNPTPEPEPTPEPTPEPNPTPNPQPNDGTDPDETDQTPQAGAPLALIDMLDDGIHAGHAVHVNALSSVLNAGTALTARYEWNFGDAGSKYNTLTGWNAAHVYETAGTYTVTLKVTNEKGLSTVATQKVTVSASNRRVIYVSNDGSDANDGLSQGAAVRTFAKAASLVDDNTEVRFRRGDVFELNEGLSISSTNVVVGAYGSGESPVLHWTGIRDYKQLISATKYSRDVTIRDLQFDSIYAPPTISRDMPQAVGVAGTNVTVLDNVFHNVGQGVNANGSPTGLLVQGNVSPTTTSVRTYFLWAEGSDIVVLGNRAANSLGEHNLRVGGADRLLIAYNEFANPDEEGKATKGTLTIHKGSYAYVAHNTLTDGALAIGPLDNASNIDDRWNWAVVENNVVKSPVYVEHGTAHVSFRHNVVQNDDNQVTFNVDGYSGSFGRTVADVSFINNTVLNYGDRGAFILAGAGTDALSLVNNLYVAPNFVAGGDYNMAPVMVYADDLSGFTRISGNVWPDASTSSRLGYGIMRVGREISADTFRTSSEWDAFEVVSNDAFQDVTLTTLYQITRNGTLVGANLPLAA